MTRRLTEAELWSRSRSRDKKKKELYRDQVYRDIERCDKPSVATHPFVNGEANTASNIKIVKAARMGNPDAIQLLAKMGARIIEVDHAQGR